MERAYCPGGVGEGFTFFFFFWCIHIMYNPNLRLVREQSRSAGTSGRNVIMHRSSMTNPASSLEFLCMGYSRP